MTTPDDRLPDAPRRQPLRPALGLIALNAAARALSFIAPGLAGRWMVKLFTRPTRHRPPAREITWLKDARRETVRGEGLSFPLYHWGCGERTILLVHGFSGRGSQMGAFAAPLVAAGFHVVAMDLPAHGGAEGKRAAPPEMAQAISVAARHLGPLDGVVAHSVGCLSTAWAMAQGLDVKSLVFLAPPATAAGRLAAFAGFAGFSQRALAQAKALLARRYGVGIDVLDTAALVPGPEVATLIFHDRDDVMVPISEGQAVADAWPHTQISDTTGLGHNRILRDPDVVEQTVMFLRDRQGRSANAPAA